MKIKEVLDALERFAPLPLQEGYDNAGLQLGLTEGKTSGALLCLDVTEEVIQEAIRLGVNLIIAHHPLLFHSLRRITGDSYIERCVMLAIKHDIAIYSAHTNLDNAKGGVSFRMAEKLDLREVKVLQPLQSSTNQADESVSGAGVWGELESPMEEFDFLQLVKQTFAIPCLRHTAFTGRTIHRVALCGGSGASLISQAICVGADAYITGEIGYHAFFGNEDTILLAEMGHYESEQYTLELIKTIITEQCPELKVYLTEVCTNPIKYM